MTTPPSVASSHPAHGILDSVGGLHVGRTGQGIECASSDIRFVSLPKPTEIDAWENWLQVQLIGIGHAHNDHETIWVDNHGRWFGLSQIHEAFYLHGESTRVALNALLLGYRSRPLLAPDQQCVSLYGEEHYCDDERVYWKKTDFAHPPDEA